MPHPTAPAKPPDRNELKVRPDKTGKVKFNFTGQSWPDVLQWLADISGMSLDWQELPGGDFLNLPRSAVTPSTKPATSSTAICWPAASRYCGWVRCFRW